MEPRTSVPLRVLRAVAEEQRCAPIEVEPVLAREIDPEALESVVESGNPDLHVAFDYAGYRVRVDGAGEVRVDGSAAAAAVDGAV
jgi:hypothetical protein